MFLEAKARFDPSGKARFKQRRWERRFNASVGKICIPAGRMQGMTPTLRRALRADLPAIVALLADDELGRTRERVGPVPDARYVAAFEAIEADPNQLLAVLEVDGAVVGTLQISYLPTMNHIGAWRGQIEAVHVDGRLRGQGLGRRMIEWAVAQCQARGCRIVQLTSNKSRTEAHRFYAGLGFEASHEGFKRML